MGRSDDFYRGKAQECETQASHLKDPAQRAPWLKMARDWRALLSKKGVRSGG
ncbi:MAG: hypothetical protein ACK41C_02615 [Phenylobacterium sp.]|uniref:hypothetical protein n=1 Tax=Phenylobacterium sp. TaxID=1871053 RepID=UPI00391CF69F